MKNSNLQVEYLDSPPGRILLTRYTPVQKVKSVFLVIPAFAEEMNKSRRTYSLLARRLAAQGHLVVIPDLYGTGDSEGDFSESDWGVWLDNIGSCLDYLSSQGYETYSVVAHRTGALLFSDYLQLNRTPIRCNKLVFWHPTVDGSSYLTQFLRLRLVSSMMNSSKEKETTKELLAKLDNGESIEVAGYVLSADLARGLKQSSLKKIDALDCNELIWMDLVSSPERELTMVSRKLIEDWQEKGIPVNPQKAIGESFWGSVEIVESCDLIDKTVRQFTESNDA